MNQRTTPPVKRFDAFLDLPIINPWNQSLHILGETIEVEQLPTGSVLVSYAGQRLEVLALMHALCGLYRGYPKEPGRWYFHAHLRPAVRIAMLALQDKAGHQILEDIRHAL